MVWYTETSSSDTFWPFPTCLKMTILGEIGYFQACRQGSPRFAKGSQGPRGTPGLALPMFKWNYPFHSSQMQVSTWFGGCRHLKPTQIYRGSTTPHKPNFQGTLDKVDLWPKPLVAAQPQIAGESPQGRLVDHQQARKLERCATLRWNLRTAVKLAHSQNCTKFV